MAAGAAFGYCGASCFVMGLAAGDTVGEVIARHFPSTGARARHELDDAWGHCYLGCCMTQHCGRAVAAGIGGTYEVLHEAVGWIPGFEHPTLHPDMFNQAVGRNFGAREGADCQLACESALLHEQLDLSPAGNPRVARPGRPAAPAPAPATVPPAAPR